MLLEGQCLDDNVATVAQRYGLSRQRYYQLLQDFNRGGMAALQPQKTGPKSNYRRGEVVVRQILRYRFLDPDSSPEVITQKLSQRGFTISQRTVHRVIADYGLQKKTLRTQPQKHPPTGPYPTRRPTPPPGAGRRPKPGTGGAPTPGR
jgi:transposase